MNETIDAPVDVSLAGRSLHNVRGNSVFLLDAIGVEGSRITVSGSLEYARGSAPYPARLSLPFLKEYDDSGRSLRTFKAPLDSAKAKWSGQVLDYSGLNFRPTSLARDGDGLLYLSTLTIKNTFVTTGGIAIFEAINGTYRLRSAEVSSDLNGPLFAFGDSVLATRQGLPSVGMYPDARRFVHVNADATAGEVIAILPGKTAGGTIAFAGSEGRWPARVYLSRLDADVVVDNTLRSGLSILAADLVDQTGSTVRSGKTVEISGTDLGDYITVVQRKRDGKYVVTGAGVTRSFSEGSVSRFVVRAGAGDDRIEYGPGVYGITSSIDGGNGDDVIITSVVDYSGSAHYVGTSSDTIRGGRGSDVILRDDKDIVSEVEDSRDLYIQ